MKSSFFSMNLLKKIKNLLRMNQDAFSLGTYVLTNSKQRRRKEIISKYVSIKAIAMSCGAYPLTYPAIYQTPPYFLTRVLTFNHLFRFLSYKNINSTLKVKNSVFVKTDELSYFKKKVLPNIRSPFVLVTGDSDLGIANHKDILENEFLLHWFAQNKNLSSKKITSLPIGVNYSTLIFEDSMGEKKQKVSKQEKNLENIRRKKLKPTLKVFANFHLNITSKRRKELYELLVNNKNMIFQKEKMPRTIMWEEQKKYAFCFSPIGNGLDCHRTWESLILGQIPVVEKTNTPLDELHKKFPIVIIQDPSEITEKNLKRWYKNYSKKFTSEMRYKLTNDYWKRKIDSYLIVSK